MLLFIFPEFSNIMLLCIYKEVLELVEISFKEEVYSGVAYKKQTLWRRIEMDVLNLEKRLQFLHLL